MVYTTEQKTQLTTTSRSRSPQSISKFAPVKTHSPGMKEGSGPLEEGERVGLAMLPEFIRRIFHQLSQRDLETLARMCLPEGGNSQALGEILDPFLQGLPILRGLTWGLVHYSRQRPVEIREQWISHSGLT